MGLQVRKIEYAKGRLERSHRRWQATVLRPVVSAPNCHDFELSLLTASVAGPQGLVSVLSVLGRACIRYGANAPVLAPASAAPQRGHPRRQVSQHRPLHLLHATETLVIAVLTPTMQLMMTGPFSVLSSHQP